MARRRLRGFTIVELLVVISIIALLMALLLPAVQQVRSAARRAQCASNLHNVGVAMEQYHELHSVFPRGRQPSNAFSPLVALLPHVDQVLVYNATNFAFPTSHPANTTTVFHRVPLYICPSDNRGFFNYAACTGNGLHPDTALEDDVDDPSNLRMELDGVFYSGEGFGQKGQPNYEEPARRSQVTRSGIRDGVTQTIAFSETLTGQGGSWQAGTSRPDARYFYAFLDEDTMPSDSACANPARNFQGNRLASWVRGSYGDALYNHFFTPNDDQIDCISPASRPTTQADYPHVDDDLWDQIFGPTDDGMDPPEPRPYRNRGRMAARSFHTGGVNVLYVDGRSVYVTNEVDSGVWRSQATRAGEEVVQQF